MTGGRFGCSIGIPDKVVDFVNGNGERGAAFVNDPSLFTAIDFVTAGTATDIRKACGLPLSDPEYWGILYDTALKLLVFGKALGVGANGAYPTPEDLKAYGDRFAPSGRVPAGTFPEEAFSENEVLSVQHAVSSSGVAQSVLDGINPKFFNADSRFGGGFYVGDNGATLVAELSEHGNIAKYAIKYDMNLSGKMVLDLTNPVVAEEWGFIAKESTKEICQAIGERARKLGYSVIEFISYRGSGINYVIYDSFDEILDAVIVTPID